MQKRIKTVVGSEFVELGTRLTPRLHLVVDYTRGGTSGITGEHFARGYQISVRHDRIDHEGLTSMLIDGKGDPITLVAAATRFDKRTFDRLVEQVYNGIHDRLVATLYAKAIAMRPDYNWDSSILPLCGLAPSDGV